MEQALCSAEINERGWAEGEGGEVRRDGAGLKRDRYLDDARRVEGERVVSCFGLGLNASGCSNS